MEYEEIKTGIRVDAKQCEHDGMMLCLLHKGKENASFDEGDWVVKFPEGIRLVRKNEFDSLFKMIGDEGTIDWSRYGWKTR